MVTNRFSHAASIVLIVLLSGSFSPTASIARAQINAMQPQIATYGDFPVPDGLTAGDWSQIQTLLGGHNDLPALSPLVGYPLNQHAYIKASNSGPNDYFSRVAVWGTTVVVGAGGDDSNATGVNGDDTDESATSAGAAFVFVRDGTSWSQQAYLKASNTDALDQFGYSLAMSGDTIVIGAPYEDSDAKGVDQADNNLANAAGAAYVFVRNGTTWTQQAYLKASNSESNDYFGYSVAISGDTIVVGAYGEDSSDTVVGGDESDNSASASGAAYVFVRDGLTWSQEAYLKASNTEADDNFGWSVSASGDTILIGAPYEDSNGVGVGGTQNNNLALESGAAYVFVRSDSNWSQQVYLKASNSEEKDRFGWAVSVSFNTAVIGAPWEAGSDTGVNGDQGDNFAIDAGAAYVYIRIGTNWSFQAYLKASNTGTGDGFGFDVAMWGDEIVIGAPYEASDATGLNGNQANDSALDSGAVYWFHRTGLTWSQHGYLKASNTESGDNFGLCVTVWRNTILVGALNEDSNATGVNGEQENNDASSAGAAYLFKPWYAFLPIVTNSG